jgi:hypothetical protein
MTEYVFFRQEGVFYIVDIPDAMLIAHGEDKAIRDNANCNPGTVQVQALDGRVVWAA